MVPVGGRDERRATRRQAGRLGAVIASTLLLAGCGAGVTAPDVTAAMPKSFAATATGDRAVSTDWIAAFGSTELVRLVALADVDGLDLAAARARIEQAEAQLASGRAGLLPTLSGSGSASHSLTPGTRSSANPPFSSRQGDDYQLGVSASWQVDLRGRLRALAAADAATLEATRIDLAAVRLNTVTAIADAYFQVAAATDRLGLARENVAIAERTLGVYQRRLEVGTATALDIAQQQSLVATQRATIPNLEIDLRQTRNSLVVLTGRAPEALAVRAPGLAGVKVPVVPSGVPARLLVRRPDLVAAEARLTAAAANVEAARAAFLPQVSLTGSSGLASAFLKNLLRPDAVAASAMASVSETIFDGGAREADLASARARHAELVANYRNDVHSALADVENALIAVEQNRRYETLQQAVVASAQKTQRLTEERLQEGTIDVTSVLDAERTLFQAKQTLVQVRLARLRAAVGLAASLGGGWSGESGDNGTEAAAPARAEAEK